MWADSLEETLLATVISLFSSFLPLFPEPFCRGQFPVMYSFLLRVYERHGACLCPPSCDEYIFLKLTPIVPNMSINSINLAVDEDDYIFSSAVHCYQIQLFYCRSILLICCLCSTCCTETFRRKRDSSPIPCDIFFYLETDLSLILWALLCLSLLK